nr:MAG TPA: hypothetical protein [Caudoviricetes sp.]
MVWYVYIYNINKKSIEKFNIFTSSRFNDCLKEIKKKLKKNNETFECFSQELKNIAMYSFWGKSEYEISIGDIFNNGTHFKISVYDQLCLNLEIFAKYVFDNIKNIGR